MTAVAIFLVGLLLEHGLTKSIDGLAAAIDRHTKAAQRPQAQEGE